MENLRTYADFTWKRDSSFAIVFFSFQDLPIELHLAVEPESHAVWTMALWILCKHQGKIAARRPQFVFFLHFQSEARNDFHAKDTWGR